MLNSEPWGSGFSDRHVIRGSQQQKAEQPGLGDLVNRLDRIGGMGFVEQGVYPGLN